MFFYLSGINTGEVLSEQQGVQTSGESLSSCSFLSSRRSASPTAVVWMETNWLLLWITSVVLLSKIFADGQSSDLEQTTTVLLDIDDASTGQTIPSTMHGVILETNINRGDDGGLYAELIYNRAFQGKFARCHALDELAHFREGSIAGRVARVRPSSDGSLVRSTVVRCSARPSVLDYRCEISQADGYRPILVSTAFVFKLKLIRRVSSSNHCRERPSLVTS